MTPFVATLAACVFSVFAVVFTSSPDSGQLPVRFHHVHFRVGDPSAAMSDVARKVDGVRVIVPGLGVGVRAGEEQLLFDRLDETDPPDLLQAALPQAYRTAVAWLAARGVAAAPPTLDAIRMAAAMPPERYHHIAFAAAEFEAVTRALRGTAAAQDDDRAMFDAGQGVRIEIVRETGRPDEFWCPMHPDVRSPDAGKCPLCAMDLVSIPPPKVGEYKLDVKALRPHRERGISGLTLTVREPDTNAPVAQFATVHEKPFHLFLVSRDLEHFEHLHPERQADGSFVLAHPIPPGEYMLIADFLPAGGTSQMVQKALLVPGRPVTRPKNTPTGGLRIALDAEDFVAGKYACLTFTVTDEKTGDPVSDLEPFLGAPAHMLLVRSDLTDAVHAHPEEAATGGPKVSFHPLVPAPGDYKLWVQFQRGGRVITAPFSLRAER